MHKTIIAVYKNQTDALKAVEVLKNNHFGKNHISLLGKLNTDDDIESKTTKEIAEVAGGTIGITTIAGALAGAGVLMIPGLGFVYGAGAILGAMVGFDIGAITSAAFGVLLFGHENKVIADAYKENLENGDTILILKVSKDKSDFGMEILKSVGTFSDIQEH